MSSSDFKPQWTCKYRKPRTPLEAQRLYDHIRTVAFLLDASSEWLIPLIPMLGSLPEEMQFGLDSFIGAIIPGAGDLVGVILGLYQVMLSWFFGVSANALIMMLFYVFCDMFIGIIPIVGDLLDVAFKANIYNLRILEKELKKSVWAPVVVIPSSHDWMPRRKKQPSASSDSSNKRFFGLF